MAKDPLKVFSETGVSVLKDEGIPMFLFKSFRHYIINNMIEDRLYRYTLKNKYGIDQFDIDYSGAPFEKKMLYDLLKNIGEDEVFYDVGACTGAYTSLVASKLSEGEVVAFEPGEVGEQIKSKLQKKHDNITLIQKAISSKSGLEGSLQRDEDGYISMTHDSKNNGEIETISGSEILSDSDLPLPTVFKIDVRGADLDVIKSLSPLFEQENCRLVYFECHLPTATKIGEHEVEKKIEPEEMKKYFQDRWSFDEILMVLIDAGFDIEYLGGGSDLYIKAYK